MRGMGSPENKLVQSGMPSLHRVCDEVGQESWKTTWRLLNDGYKGK